MKIIREIFAQLKINAYLCIRNKKESLTLKISTYEKEHQQGDSFHYTWSSPHHRSGYLQEPSPFED